METPVEQDQLKNFDSYRSALDRFIWFNDVDLVIDDGADTCYFAPWERKVAIAWRWLKEMEASEDKDFEELKIKFWIFHEFSHYRDMIKESDITWDESMLRVLQNIAKKKIIFEEWWEKRKIPIWHIIHTLYNCIDDIVVNTEVWNYTHAEISKGDMKSVYQRYLFPDYKKDKEGEKDENGGKKTDDKSKEKKKKELNLDWEVDYSKYPLFEAFPYYFLRGYMVTDQKIKLPDVIESILFSKETWKPLPWSMSIKKLREVFKAKIEEAKNWNNPRYAKFEKNLIEQMSRLNVLLSPEKVAKINTKLKVALLDPLLPWTVIRLSWWREKTKWKDQFISTVLSLEDIVGLFTVTMGKENDHRLVVSPARRYDIISEIFEPIMTTFILMALLDKDLPKKKKKQGKGKWEGQWGGWGWWGGWGGLQEWEDSEEWEDWEDWEWEDWELEGKIKDLKDAIDYKKKKEEEQKRKDEAKKTNRSLSDILKNHGFTEEDAKNAIKSLNKITQNFKWEIVEFTEILKEELKQLELDFEKKIVLARKWKRTNYDSVVKKLWEHFDDMDISRERIYEKKKVQEALQQEFKKLVFYFMLDVSWSTMSLRGDNWMLNWTAIALAIALHNVEQDIRDLIWDPDYSIPIKFVIYSNWASLITCKFNSFDEMLAEANYDIVCGSWWTSDADWWSKSADVILKDFDDNGTYVEDIEKGNMKAFVLQIADTDVTPDGVLELKRKVKSKFWVKWEEILKGIERKRLIIWEMREEEKFLTEEEIGKMTWEFKPVIIEKNWHPVRDERWRVRVKINEVCAKRKSDIKESVGKLFQNLFADSLKSK